jgi:hypothetical protein
VPQYGDSLYGLSTYGSVNTTTLSVMPMTTLVLNYTECYVNWQTPSGSYTIARLVRNQNNFSESPEDGVVVFEQETSNLSTLFLDDGGFNHVNSIGIVAGKPIYYTMWLFSEGNWFNAGSVEDIIPSDHGMQDAIINYLPRVFTSAEQSALAEVDKTSALYGFLSSMGFVIDELLTSLDLLLPNATLSNTPVSLLPLEVGNYGLTEEVSLPAANQKKLVRDAIYMYNVKGTKDGIQTYCEDLTGFPTTITTSVNGLISPAESTFYEGTGNWTATNATLSSSTDVTPPTVANAIDETYTCKIVASAAGSMSLGKDFPITRGVPIDNYTTSPDVTLSVRVLSPSSAGSITPSIITYDGYGNQVGEPAVGSAVSATNTWKTATVTSTPSSYAVSPLSSASGDGTYVTYTSPTDHGLFVGNSVTITGFNISGYNVTDATVLSVPTSTTFTIANATTDTTTTTGYVTNNAADADYLGITLSWSAAGTYYVDMVCLNEGDSVVYNDANAVDIFLGANKTNYINNPSFESNVTDSWTLAGSATASQSTTVPSGPLSGSKSAKVIGTGSWTYTPNTLTLLPTMYGQYFTSSVYLQNTSAVTLTLKTLNGSTVVDTATVTVPASSSYARSSVTLLIPPNSAGTVLEFVIAGITGTVYLDAVQLEQTYTPSDYFDGNLPESFGAVWGGDSNNSTSYLYYNKGVKIERLARTISDWLPMNTLWKIRSYAGLEYTTLTV